MPAPKLSTMATSDIFVTKAPVLLDIFSFRLARLMLLHVMPIDKQQDDAERMVRTKIAACMKRLSSNRAPLGDIAVGHWRARLTNP